MKKKFTLAITTPCSENFDRMIPNSTGSFCDSCAKNVIDFSKKTNSEISKFIADNKGKNICARIKSTQLEEEFEYNEMSKINTLKYAAIAASVLLTSNVVGQEKEPVKIEVISPEPNNHIVGKIAVNHQIEEEVSIIVKGKLLDSKTNKPLNNKTYPNLLLTINNSPTPFKVNAKTGEFAIPLKILKNSNNLSITIVSGDYYFSKTIPFDIKWVKGNVLQQNIIIATEELSKVMIMGGLGVNYIDKKGSGEL
ncbi:hypothetical protein SGQ44_06270 [Flavobacterium sp. Fl-77]|uniref:Uncharacterized protein n=1 Tax=Flavobacterium flavipigmentatum TaxID=2893884 RepID=A0AAJ2VXM3_9FLAO|nr:MULTISPECIES: hypothetical protein [unclassified Flavobacterium]MDX6181612.1 hypothetical protein [Flavobacterium sp. Fl-33]MDX6185354.1 hypothetical protein [Flavobacterium sp. Fl-77]UFH37458.1 hypothetical protein LNP22_12000 [Flavobacterium sp. F-70]